MYIKVDFDTLFDFYCGLILRIFRDKHGLGDKEEVVALQKLEKEIASKLPFPIGEKKEIGIFIDDDDLVYINKYLFEQMEIQKNMENSKLIGSSVGRYKVLKSIYRLINLHDDF